MIHFLSISLFPILMIMAGAGDALSLRIPNWLTLTITLAFFPMAWATGMPMNEFGLHVLIGFVFFVVGFVFFSFGMFGGGDAKLLAAASLWFGTSQAVPFLVFTAFAGGGLALLIGIWSMISMDWEVREVKWFTRLRTLKPNIPYGYAFAIGAILAFPQSWWMKVAG
jgi:prepilin peptidase CpaA